MSADDLGWMHARVALLLLALLTASAPLVAQEVWNDDRTLELVRAATARRAVQLADTGLRDYTARATGYLSFLVQVGDGFRLPPALIKSDQIAVEVFWAAPNHSKQRIVGRRDTLLLPTDINYHRDHLGIVQNNFPETIRLGDGDEVLDVPHPLSARGQTTYDFAIGDSLAIRSGALSLDVMMVRVRPKDDRVPAAVGAIYIDRATASVVRMSFSFTRAALRDQQLEDVSVILENSLVNGRFWLPRRQEIEIRRSASWMDFPARGIIRGRWEICCVEANTTLPAQLFVGPEIVEAPLAEQRRYPFTGEVLDDLPDEVRAFDAEEVRAVQDEARALVQASALARVKRRSLAARGVSDFVRSDRVEGLALGVGISQRLGSGVSIGAAGRYGTADERAKGRGSIAWRKASGSALVATIFDDFHQVGDTPEGSALRNSVAAQEFGADWTDPIGARGYDLRLELVHADGGRVVLGVTAQRESPLAIHTAPASGRFEPTLAAARVDRTALHVGWDGTRILDGGAGTLRAAFRLDFSRAEFVDLGGRTDVVRGFLDVGLSRAIGNGRLVTRTFIGSLSAIGSVLPDQDAFYVGGPVTGPGYDFHSLAAFDAVTQRLEWQFRIPFIALDLGRFGRVPSSLVLAPYVHGVWLNRPVRGGAAWHPAVGLGTIGIFDLLRVDVARGLRDGRWLFSVDVAREFWPVL